MRIILIDTASGYIWGDSADLEGKIWQGDSAAEYARALDESLGEYGRSYALHAAGAAPSGARGYLAYRADIDGSEAVAIVQDGQDQEVIDAVSRDCRYLGFIEVSRS